MNSEEKMIENIQKEIEILKNDIKEKENLLNDLIEQLYEIDSDDE